MPRNSTTTTNFSVDSETHGKNVHLMEEPSRTEQITSYLEVVDRLFNPKSLEAYDYAEETIWEVTVRPAISECFIPVMTA